MEEDTQMKWTKNDRCIGSHIHAMAETLPLPLAPSAQASVISFPSPPQLVKGIWSRLGRTRQRKKPTTTPLLKEAVAAEEDSRFDR
jgi:hypothetical protein